MYANHSEEDDSGTEGNLSRWDAAGIFRKAQDLN